VIKQTYDLSHAEVLYLFTDGSLKEEKLGFDTSRRLLLSPSAEHGRILRKLLPTGKYWLTFDAVVDGPHETPELARQRAKEL